MDSNQVQGNDEHHLHNVDPQQVVHSEEKQEHENEVKSVFSKVKAKAKKIKNSIKKHGQNVLDYGHDHNNEDHHITDDHDLDKYEGQQLHGIHESEGVRSAAPTSEKVENLEKTEVNFEGTRVEGEETNEKARVVDVFPTTEIEEEHITEQGEKSIGLEAKYNQTELTDLTGTGTAEIDIAEVEKSIERVNVEDEQENVTETKSPYAETGSLNQFVPDLYTDQVQNSEANSGGTKVVGEEPNEEPQVLHVNPTTDINQNITTDQAKTFVYEQNSEEDSHGSGSRDEAYTPPEAAAGSEEIGITAVEKCFERIDVEDEVKHSPEQKVFPNVSETQYPATATGSHNQLVPEISTPTKTENPSAESHEYIPELSSAAKTQDGSHDQFDPETISTATNRDHEIFEETEQTFNNNESGDASNKSDSTAEYGKNIDQSLNEKLGPDYGEVAEVGSAVKSKVSETGTDAETENEVKEESSVQSPGKGVVGTLKDFVGSWFGKTGENQSTQGDEGLTKNEKSGVEVEQINKAEG